LNEAQNYLDTSYSLAKAMANYDTSYIDTQQARLHLLRAMTENDGNNVWGLFQQAHNLLIPLEDNIYKYRQIVTYKRFFDSKFNSLSKKNKQEFINIINAIKKRLENSGLFSKGFSYNNYTIDTCYHYFSEILEQTQDKTE
jgi:hypothetical protein